MGQQFSPNLKGSHTAPKDVLPSSSPLRPSKSKQTADLATRELIDASIEFGAKWVAAGREFMPSYSDIAAQLQRFLTLRNGGKEDQANFAEVEAEFSRIAGLNREPSGPLETLIPEALAKLRSSPDEREPYTLLALLEASMGEHFRPQLAQRQKEIGDRCGMDFYRQLRGNPMASRPGWDAMLDNLHQLGAVREFLGESIKPAAEKGWINVGTDLKFQDLFAKLVDSSCLMVTDEVRARLVLVLEKEANIDTALVFGDARDFNAALRRGSFLTTPPWRFTTRGRPLIRSATSQMPSTPTIDSIPGAKELDKMLSDDKAAELVHHLEALASDAGNFSLAQFVGSVADWKKRFSPFLLRCLLSTDPPIRQMANIVATTVFTRTKGSGDWLHGYEKGTSIYETRQGVTKPQVAMIYGVELLQAEVMHEGSVSARRLMVPKARLLEAFAQQLGSAASSFADSILPQNPSAESLRAGAATLRDVSTFLGERVSSSATLAVAVRHVDALSELHSWAAEVEELKSSDPFGALRLIQSSGSQLLLRSDLASSHSTLAPWIERSTVDISDRINQQLKDLPGSTPSADVAITAIQAAVDQIPSVNLKGFPPSVARVVRIALLLEARDGAILPEKIIAKPEPFSGQTVARAILFDLQERERSGAVELSGEEISLVEAAAGNLAEWCKRSFITEYLKTAARDDDTTSSMRQVERAFEAQQKIGSNLSHEAAVVTRMEGLLRQAAAHAVDGEFVLLHQQFDAIKGECASLHPTVAAFYGSLIDEISNLLEVDTARRHVDVVRERITVDKIALEETDRAVHELGVLHRLSAMARTDAARAALSNPIPAIYEDVIAPRVDYINFMIGELRDVGGDRFFAMASEFLTGEFVALGAFKEELRRHRLLLGSKIEPSIRKALAAAGLASGAVVASIRADRRRAATVKQQLSDALDNLESYLDVVSGVARNAPGMSNALTIFSEEGPRLHRLLDAWLVLERNLRRSGDGLQHSIVPRYKRVRERAATLDLARWFPELKAS